MTVLSKICGASTLFTRDVQLACAVFVLAGGRDSPYGDVADEFIGGIGNAIPEARLTGVSAPRTEQVPGRMNAAGQRSLLLQIVLLQQPQLRRGPMH